MKVCSQCREEKPLEAFRNATQTRKRAECRTCGNIKRNERKRQMRREPGKKTPQKLLDYKNGQYRKRRAIQKLLSGKFKGDGPCWCCRNQAIGETPYRLCVICAG